MKTIQSIIDSFEKTIKQCEDDLRDAAENPDKYSDKDIFLLLDFYGECKSMLFEYDCLVPWLIDEFGHPVFEKLHSHYTKINRQTRRGTKLDALKYRLGIAWKRYTIDGVTYLVGATNSSDILFIEKLEEGDSNVKLD